MKYFAIIISIMVMALAVVPCCASDNCGDDLKPELTHKKNSDKPESPCSPFESCTCCPGVCIAPSVELVLEVETVIEKSFTLYKQSFISFYCANFWQPPKIAC